MPTVLVLCPTFDHVDTLYASITSVRAQTFTDWELAVIGDGAPDRSFEIVDAIRAEDNRIRAVRHPKSERFGEVYRDPVIRGSSADLVCHLSDDDIWMPDHLARMVALLENAEWANQAPLRVLPDGSIEWWPINHGTPAIRRSVTRHLPLSAGLNYVAYRREAYLRLPEGWTCAPWEAGTSDVYMWAKFFRNPNLVVASSAMTSAVKLPSWVGERAGRTPARRMAEIMPWLARSSVPGLADGLRRAGSLYVRMIMLFAVHGAAACASLEDAFAASGLEPVGPEVEPRPAVNGAPMILPITEAQRLEAEAAWHFVRAYEARSFPAAHAERARLRSSLAERPVTWGSALEAFARVGSIEATLVAAEDYHAARPDDPFSFVIAARRLVEAGRGEEAAPLLERIEQSWPEHPALPALRASSTSGLR